MAVQFKIPVFEGPLDLLLQLVEQEKLPITDVALAEVTDQYLEYIEHAKEITKDELADFLFVAARLLLLKSRLLLPDLATELEEGGLSLEQQLRMYREFAEAAKRLDAQIKKKRFLFPREKPPIQAGMFSPPRSLTAARLAQVFGEILKSIEPVIRLPHAAIERVVSIQEKIAVIRAALAAQGAVSFQTLVRGATSKTEMVVSFLALLELVKQRDVTVDQDELFTDIVITASAPA